MDSINAKDSSSGDGLNGFTYQRIKITTLKKRAKVCHYENVED